MFPAPNGVPARHALVAQLLTKVEERRRAGEYPPGLDEDLSAHYRRLLSRPIDPPRAVDLRGPLTRIAQALPLRSDRIPMASQIPAGAAFHKAMAKLLGRQTQGVLEQVQAFAEPVRLALDALTTAVEDLTREIREDLAAQVSALIDRQAALDRASVLVVPGEEALGPDPRAASARDPWRDRHAAEYVTGCSPVVHVGAGESAFMETLKDLGVDARGVDDINMLQRLADASIGGLVLLNPLRNMALDDVLAMVELASGKVRPGGRVLIETSEAHPVHPAYLIFLLKEAGFASADVEWLPSPPESDLAEARGSASESSSTMQRFHQLLFDPGDALLIAKR